MKEKISVIGLGYVGLPVALAFARRYPNTVGFDINCPRIEELKKGHDRNKETASAILQAGRLLEEDFERARRNTAMKNEIFYKGVNPELVKATRRA